MKKLLITSTALVATAGMAAADGHAGISMSGAAEMGIASVDTANTAAGLAQNPNAAVDGDPRFHSAIDVTFKLAGETDGGLMFGASIDLDETDDGANPFGGGVGDNGMDGSVFLKGGFGNLTLGDTDGARDWAMTEVAMGTAIADDHTAHDGYSGNGQFEGGMVLRYDNTFGDFGVAISHEMGAEPTAAVPAGGDSASAIGVKYSADLGGTTLGLGAGYTDAGNRGNVAGISASTSIAGFKVVLNYSSGEIGAGAAAVDMSHTGIGIGYTMDALSFHANWGENEVGAVKTDGFGLNVNYNLGGGAIVALGYGSDDLDDRYSLGVRMNF